MFNRTNLHFHEGPTSTSVHVTEKRAPTDESVRLLAEMESAAVARIKAAIRITDTHFECVVHVVDDYLNDRKLIAAIFSLNGKKLEARTTFDRLDSMNVIEKLVKEVATVIACEILNKCMTEPLLRLLK